MFILIPCFHLYLEWFIGEGSFGISKIGLEDRSSKLKYVLIWLEGLDIFNFLYQSIGVDLLVDLLVLSSFLYWSYPKVLTCLRFDEMRNSIYYEFYMKYILKTYRIILRRFIFALLFIYLYSINNTEGLVPDLQEVKYAGCTPRVPYLLGCGLRMWHC